MNRLGDLERAVMELMWERGAPATVRDVVRGLADDRDLAHTTVMTVMDRLARKGMLHREREGRAWRYVPAASREAYVAELMIDALGMTGDRDAALARFVQSVSGDEAESIRQALGELGELGEPADEDEPPQGGPP